MEIVNNSIDTLDWVIASLPIPVIAERKSAQIADWLRTHVYQDLNPAEMRHGLGVQRYVIVPLLAIATVYYLSQK